MVKWRNKLDNHGFTLVELIVTMAVSSILLTLVLSIFNVGNIMYRDIYDDIEIQQQGHFIMDFMTNNIMASSNIEDVLNYQRASLYNTSEKLELGVMKFKDNSLEQKNMHIFSIQKDPKVEGKSIRYGKTNIATIELGNYIKCVYVSPLPKENSYKEARGVELTLEMKKGRSTIAISKSIYFRKH